MFTLSQIFAIQNRFRCVIDNKYIYHADSNILFKTDVSNGVTEHLEFPFEIQELASNDNELFIYFSDKLTRIEKEKFSIIPEQDVQLTCYPIPPYHDLQLAMFGDDIYTTVSGLFNLVTKEIVWMNEEVVNPVIIEGFLFSHSYDRIERFDLNNGKHIWSHSIKDKAVYFTPGPGQTKKVHEGEIDRFLGVYNNILWVLLNNGLMLGFDIDTGSIIHEVSGPVNYPATLYMIAKDNTNNLYPNKHSIFDKDNGIIIRLFHAGDYDAHNDWYLETDIKVTKPEPVFQQIKNTSTRPFEIDGNPCPVWPFDDQYVYLCNYREYMIAIFNRRSKEIEWVDEVASPTNRSFITKMEIHENRWYIFDNSNNLYVYQK